ncbi:La-related protein 7 [Dioscorea alata]|uniref:La-related protein 7 n=2 Tax=Dioscorea alata TaxID=55571 RepID=A0ACB7TV07_DIOAL|nr:La-related protein 7 [Dioscorea alata]KAH7651824.1 La-related protein 7 [Dioscorea alata]
METGGETSPPPPPPPTHPSEGTTTITRSDPLTPSDSFEEDQPVNPLSEDLRGKIVRQVEYYFSDGNLPADKFLLKQMKKDKAGFVPIALIASFRKMKKLVQDLCLIEAALRTSTELVVSSDGKGVKRSKPLPIAEINDAKARTILVENLPQDYSTENMQKIFGNVGKINEITICDPHLAEELANNKKVKAVSSKLHALIEYDTVETAKSAVATLNDEKNWRTGMRVEILLERMRKYGLIQKDHKETLSEKKTRAEEPNTDAACVDGRSSKATYDNVGMANKGEEEHLPSEKAGRRGRYKSRGRGQLPQNSNKDGNDHGSSLSSEIVSKPLPGPKMPDGTRGFTMGRGKPIV